MTGTKAPKLGLDRAKTGRAKGTPNKTTALLKDAILIAASEAGGKDGLVGYLRAQAKESPAAFLSLLGKVIPTQIAGDPDAPISITVRREIVRPPNLNPNG